MRTRTTDEWYRLLKSMGIPVSPICTPKEAFRKAYAEGSPIVATVEHPTRGPMPVIGTVCELSETPGRVDRRAPIFGENTQEVLTEMLGMSEEEIEQLESKHVIHRYHGDLV